MKNRSCQIQVIFYSSFKNELNIIKKIKIDNINFPLIYEKKC